MATDAPMPRRAIDCLSYTDRCDHQYILYTAGVVGMGIGPVLLHLCCSDLASSIVAGETGYGQFFTGSSLAVTLGCLSSR